LLVDNDYGSDEITKTEYITVEKMAPIADFTADQTDIVEGESVEFTDTSSNNPTSWNWVFTGGSPSNSAAQNPTVIYDSEGLYDVKLIVENAGGTNEILKQNYISVSSSQPQPISQWIYQNDNEVTDVKLNNNGTFVNNSSWIVEGDKKRISFKGGYVEILHLNDYILPNGSISFWVNGDTLPIGQDKGMIGKDAWGYITGGHLQIYINEENKIVYRLQTTTSTYTITSEATLTAGNWYHIVAVFGQGGRELYINGVLDTNKTTPDTGLQGNEEPIGLGGLTWQSETGSVTPIMNMLDGMMYDIRIYDIKLTSDNVNYIYTKG
jgi:PKD repeat protein